MSLAILAIGVPQTFRSPRALSGSGVATTSSRLAAGRLSLPLHASKQPHSSPTPGHRPSKPACTQTALQPGALQILLPDGGPEAPIGPAPTSPPSSWHRKQPSLRQTGAGAQQEPRPWPTRLGLRGPLTKVQGRLDLQLLPLPAARVCPASDLWQAAAMATTELLCCDLRAGV